MGDRYIYKENSRTNIHQGCSDENHEQHKLLVRPFGYKSWLVVGSDFKGQDEAAQSFTL